MTNNRPSVGTKVTGCYFSTPISGTVWQSRYHTINPELMVVHVTLDEPIDIGGLVREGVCFEIRLDGFESPSLWFQALEVVR